MNLEKEKLLNTAYRKFMEASLFDVPLDDVDEFVSANVMGYGTAIDEKILSISDYLNLIMRQREQGAGIEMHFDETPVFRKVTDNGEAAVFVDEVKAKMTVEGEKVILFFRLTSVLEYSNEKWKVIHWHGSKPDSTAGETDTWHINEWKRRNAELERMVEERTRDLKIALEELKATQVQLIQSEKMASLGELTAGIAHEIQNPLNFVNNFSEVSNELIVEMYDELNKGNIDVAKDIGSDIKQNLEKINHHGKRADAIVKGMLQHSRSSTGVKEPTDLNALADEYLRLAYHGLRAKDPRDSVNQSFNASIKTDFDESIGDINIVPQDIGRVLLNLINNAFYAVNEKRKLGPNGYEPAVSVATKLINGKAEVSIKDNGNGIPPKVLDKIFQPFFTTKPTGEGTGLGLSLAYDIIKAHGGELKVETKEGEFAEFIFTLPIG